MFSIDKFVISDEERRGPKARIFSAGLLNWIQLNQAKEIKDQDGSLWDKVYNSTKYGDQALKAAVEPTFNQSPLYKHHFIIFSRLATELRRLPIQDRYKKLRTLLKDAGNLYEQIYALPMDPEKHSRGDHIQPWLNALNKFYRTYVKADER